MASHAEFGSETDASTVAKAFPDVVRGKVILITGVNAKGIGATTASALASQGPKLLILTGRSRVKVDEVMANLKASYPDVACRFLEIDLSSQASIRKAAAEVMTYKESIDILINNAGVMALPERVLSVDKIEMQFATNHIGHFLFTSLIISKLIDAAKKNPAGATRVINVSSFGHKLAPVRFSDYNFEKPDSQLPEDEHMNKPLAQALGFDVGGGSDPKAPGYNTFAAYGQSKTANFLLSLCLNQKLAARGIKSFGLHPGSIDTELARHVEPRLLAEMHTIREHAGLQSKTLEQGSSTTLVAALDPALKVDGTNVYLSDCQIEEASPWAVDSVAADKLWKLSESLVGEKFTLA